MIDPIESAFLFLITASILLFIFGLLSLFEKPMAKLLKALERNRRARKKRLRITDTFHPLDDPEFREWVREHRDEYDYVHFTYGLQDSKWAEVYEDFLDDKSPDWETRHES